MSDDSIVNPAPFPGFEAKTVFYIPVDSATETILKTLQPLVKKERTFPGVKLLQLDNKVVLYGCIGAPAAVVFLEGLIKNGAKEIIVLGFCGSLSRRTRLFDVVSVGEAVSDEGTSRHYLPEKNEFLPAFELKEKIDAKIAGQGLAYLTGAVVSTDAPYRETKTWLQNHLSKGMDCVDMETSAVFALAEFRKIHSAALLIVSDELSEHDHNSGFAAVEMDECVKQYFLPFLVPDQSHKES